MARLVGVKFNTASKVYDFDPNGMEFRPGDMVVVEVEKGLGMGTVAMRPRNDEPLPGKTLKKVIRKADPGDIERHTFNKEREAEAQRVCREKINQYKLPMKLVRVEYLFDSSKAIFFFTSETRVDFRELVKDLASAFHTRIEMRQIGVRDEAKMLGGLGPCGRVLCCTGHLSDFEPVTIKMAKDQNLALNPVKISGICGRLMCCLSYEHAMYKSEKQRKAAAGTAAEGQTEAKKEGCNCGCGCNKRHEQAKQNEPAKQPDRQAKEKKQPQQGQRPQENRRPQEGLRPQEGQRPRENKRPQEGTRPQESPKPQETNKAPESFKVQEGQKPQESPKPQEMNEAQKSFKAQESQRPQEGPKPQEMNKAPESFKAQEGQRPQESPKPQEMNNAQKSFKALESSKPKEGTHSQEAAPVSEANTTPEKESAE